MECQERKLVFSKVTATVLVAATHGHGRAQQEDIFVGQTLVQGLISKGRVILLNLKLKEKIQSRWLLSLKNGGRGKFFLSGKGVNYTVISNASPFLSQLRKAVFSLQHVNKASELQRGNDIK